MFKERFRRFMSGRYGNDNLNRFLSVFALFALVLSASAGRAVFYPLALFALALGTFRAFSRNAGKRSRENYAYLRLRGEIVKRFSAAKARFSGRRTHRFYKCPSCRALLRVPKGAGKINVTCPKCRASFRKKA
jgi:LSD1 subclass zinc finger protein